MRSFGDYYVLANTLDLVTQLRLGRTGGFAAALPGRRSTHTARTRARACSTTRWAVFGEAYFDLTREDQADRRVCATTPTSKQIQRRQRATTRWTTGRSTPASQSPLPCRLRRCWLPVRDRSAECATAFGLLDPNASANIDSVDGRFWSRTTNILLGAPSGCSPGSGSGRALRRDRATRLDAAALTPGLRAPERMAISQAVPIVHRVRAKPVTLTGSPDEDDRGSEVTGRLGVDWQVSGHVHDLCLLQPGLQAGRLQPGDQPGVPGHVVVHLRFGEDRRHRDRQQELVPGRRPDRQRPRSSPTTTAVCR
ncbi:MAG: hypothetical protein U5R48_19095 [Gammaproteobacteria bacterium]|nr:hypothetical protein [Gammaproteobacteria bacterium]